MRNMRVYVALYQGAVRAIGCDREAVIGAGARAVRASVEQTGNVCDRRCVLDLRVLVWSGPAPSLETHAGNAAFMAALEHAPLESLHGVESAAARWTHVAALRAIRPLSEPRAAELARSLGGTPARALGGLVVIGPAWNDSEVLVHDARGAVAPLKIAQSIGVL